MLLLRPHAPRCARAHPPHATQTAAGAQFASYATRVDRLSVLKTSFPEQLALTGGAAPGTPLIVSVVAFRRARHGAAREAAHVLRGMWQSPGAGTSHARRERAAHWSKPLQLHAPPAGCLCPCRAGVRSDVRYVVSAEPRMTGGTGFVSTLSLMSRFGAWQVAGGKPWHAPVQRRACLQAQWHGCGVAVGSRADCGRLPQARATQQSHPPTTDKGELKFLQFYNLTCNDCGGWRGTRCLNGTSCTLPVANCTCATSAAAPASIGSGSNSSSNGGGNAGDAASASSPSPGGTAARRLTQSETPAQDAAAADAGLAAPVAADAASAEPSAAPAAADAPAAAAPAADTGAAAAGNAPAPNAAGSNRAAQTAGSRNAAAGNAAAPNAAAPNSANTAQTATNATAQDGTAGRTGASPPACNYTQFS